MTLNKDNTMVVITYKSLLMEKNVHLVALAIHLESTLIVYLKVLHSKCPRGTFEP